MKFSAEILKIGINPHVIPTEDILHYIFTAAKKDKGHIPVSITIGDKVFLQNLVKYSGKWRLYLNGPMRKAAGKEVGDIITFGIDYDSTNREMPMHEKLEAALAKNKKARDVFLKQTPSLQKEIVRYIYHLKTEESIDRNVARAINFLLGKERFVGRDPL